MVKISPALASCLAVAKAHAEISRAFDARLGQGIGMSDFAILYRLSQAPDEMMRRGDLAEAMGLTASGITRLLLPMEKIGLVRREADRHDGRVSFVKLAPGGKRILADALEKAEMLAEECMESALDSLSTRKSALIY